MLTEEAIPIATEYVIPATDQLVELKELPPRQVGTSVDIVELRRELTTQAARHARLEPGHLRKLLSAQDGAKLHAHATAAQLQRQLKSLESENNRVRSELKRTQDQLALVKHENSIDLRRAADREAAIRQQLVDTRNQASAALEKVSVRRKKRLALAIGVLFPGLILAAVICLHFRPSGVNGDAVKGDSVPTASTNPPARTSTPAVHDFAGGLGRLDHLLVSFKGEKPEEVLRRVHRENVARGVSVCSFAWRNREASLEVGANEGMNLNSALSRCADAVEKSARKAQK